LVTLIPAVDPGFLLEAGEGISAGEVGCEASLQPANSAAVASTSALR
jgi:hypothetical protein